MGNARRLSDSRIILILTVIPCAVFAVLCSLLSVWRFQCFQAGEDLAMFDQMLWSVRTGHGLVTTISGNWHLNYPHHFFGEHFSPILYLMAWPAGLSRGPEALLVIQAVFVAFSAIPAGRIVARLTKLPWTMPLTALLWLSLPGLWQATLYDFHMSALGLLFCLLCLQKLLEGSKQAWLWAFFYVLCMEDAPFYLFFAALVVGYCSGNRILGFRIAAAALIYGLIVLWIAIPAYSPTGRHLLALRFLVPDTPAAAVSHLWDLITSPSRWISLRTHLSSFGFLPLAGGFFLIPALSTLGLMWLSADGYQATLQLHYPFSLYHLFLLASAGGVCFLIRWKNRFHSRLLRQFVSAVLVALCVAGPLSGWVALKKDIHSILGRTHPAGARALAPTRAFLSRIPQDASCSAPIYLSAHVARRHSLGLLSYPPKENDWMVFPLRSNADLIYPFDKNLYRQWAASLLATPSPYGVWGMTNGIAVLHRGDSTARNAAALEEMFFYWEAEALYSHVGRNIADPLTSNGWARESSPLDPPGEVLFGPYDKIAPGSYKAHFLVRMDVPDAGDFIAVDVTASAGQVVLARQVLNGKSDSYRDISLPITLHREEVVEFRCVRLAQKGWVRLDYVCLEHVD